VVEAGALALPRSLTDEERGLRRPGRSWFNGLLTVLIMATLITGFVDPAVAFMVGTALALLVNYPEPAAQRARVDAHARAALMMAGVLLAAGAFTGKIRAAQAPLPPKKVVPHCSQ
jgi:CitMHS family citrate-Mg2+:H+ or citrate-Ca2+:H+ symporter